jgi:Protein of unknown function (DUF3808)
LPFDAFVRRKIAKWKARAERLELDVVDAVGASPHEEMVYYYGGHKWMDRGQLEGSLRSLGWVDEEQGRARWDISEEVDERSILALLKAVVYRRMGELGKARECLEQVMKEERKAFRGEMRDDWVPPSACYEMAVLAWEERKTVAGDVEKRRKVGECEKWLNKVDRWGSYELDAR